MGAETRATGPLFGGEVKRWESLTETVNKERVHGDDLLARMDKFLDSPSKTVFEAPKAARLTKRK